MKMSEQRNIRNKSYVRTGTDGAEKDRGRRGQEPITGVRWARGKLLLKDTGKKCPIELKGREQATWAEITEWLSAEEGYQLKRQSVQKAFSETMKRIATRLLEDPYIRDWYLENIGALPESEGDS